MRAFLFSLIAFSASLSFAAADEKLCKPGVYCVEEMACIGRIATPPKGMASDYFVNKLYFKSFKSTKKLLGGKRELVDSLMINEVPAGQTPDITLVDAWAQADFNYGWYGAPAYVDGKTVKVWGGGDRTYGFTFTIVSSEQKEGYRLDRLVGQETTTGSVVPDYVTDYECEAKVVAAPSRIDDSTSATK